jgi:putative transposase
MAPTSTSAVGFDGGKLIKGRKRHILVDTLGLLLMVIVHSAGISDKEGAKALVRWATMALPRLFVICADQAYRGLWLEWISNVYTWTMHIIKPEPGTTGTTSTKGFKVLPKRWIVERTFAWLGNYRRLSRDYEYLTRSSSFQRGIYLSGDDSSYASSLVEVEFSRQL